jgi:hypothetical protein
MDSMAWKPDAVAWVHKAIERHGGLERWQRLRLTLSPTSLTGLLPWLKGVGRTFTLPIRVEIEPGRARAIFSITHATARRGGSKQGESVSAIPLWQSTGKRFEACASGDVGRLSMPCISSATR